MIQALRIDLIEAGGGTQTRVELSNETVDDYLSALLSGAEFPPIKVFTDGSKFWLADGFHRLFAHMAAGKVEIQADVKPGTRRDALKFACGANAQHGLRRSNADKRHAVEILLGDEEWGALANRVIAEMAQVSHTLVAKVRAELEDKKPAVATLPEPAKRQTAEPLAILPGDGKQDPDDDTGKTAPAVATLPDAGDDSVGFDESDGMPSTEEVIRDMQSDVERLTALVNSLQSEDKGEEILSLHKRADHAERRLAEIQEGAATKDRHLAFLSTQLKRCGRAVGVTDTDKIAPAVEAMARAASGGKKSHSKG